MFRAMRELPLMGEMTENLEMLLVREEPGETKAARVEEFCARIAEELNKEGLSSSRDPYLEPHAFEIMKHIRSREIRELHVMEG